MRASLKWVIFRAWVVNCQRAEPFPAETRYFFRQKQCVTQSGNRNLEIAVAGIVSVHDFVVLGSYGRQNVEALQRNSLADLVRTSPLEEKVFFEFKRERLRVFCNRPWPGFCDVNFHHNQVRDPGEKTV